MGEFWAQIFTLLTDPPGSLTYHLVLAFSIAGALPTVLGHLQSVNAVRIRRMLSGLLTLLGLRVLVFAASSLAWQGLINPQGFLPLLDRLFNLLGIFCIIWLWAFPDPHRLADNAIILLSITSIAATILILLVAPGQYAVEFNGSRVDRAIEILTLLLLSVGAGILLMRRKQGWEIGIVLLSIMWLGHLVQVLTGLPEGGDFPGLVRLSQLVAYPLLLALPVGIVASQERSFPERTPEVNGSQFSEMLQILDELEDAGDKQEACRFLVQVIGSTLLADVSLAVPVKGDHFEEKPCCGYDFVRRRWLRTGFSNVDFSPRLAAALANGECMLLNDRKVEEDLPALGSILRIDSTGSVLAVPSELKFEPVTLGIFLVNPYSGREWKDRDLLLAERISTGAARLLNDKLAGSELRVVLEARTEALAAARKSMEMMRREQASLQAQLAMVTHTDDHQVNNHQLADLLAANKEAQQVITRLRAENVSLQDALADLQETGFTGLDALSPAEQGTQTGAPEAEIEFLEGELRLALEELAHLRVKLSEADRRILTLQSSSKDFRSTDLQPGKESPLPISVSARPVYADLARELRRPLVSIIGYTDFLLSESVGILGALQRKFLERVRSASERMSHLLDELEVITQPAADLPSGRVLSDLDLDDVLDTAVAQVAETLRDRGVALRIEIYPDLPRLTGAAAELEPVVSRLLERASLVTPPRGEVILRAEQREDHSRQAYVLIQVIDQGPVIQTEQIFRRTGERKLLASDLNHGDDLSTELPIMRDRLESLGGRIWFESDLEKGTVCSILLPVAPTAQEAEA